MKLPKFSGKAKHDKFVGQNLELPIKVLMLFSNSFDGPYARDISRGSYKSKVTIGFISLSNAETPEWASRYSVNVFSNRFGVDLKLPQKIFQTVLTVHNFKPNIIQTHLFEAGLVGLLAAKITRTPVIHTRHHIDEHYLSGRFFHRLIDRLTAKLANHVVVFSFAAKKWLVEVEGIKESHVTVINQGFDFSYLLAPSKVDITHTSRTLGFSEERINVLCVARYSKVKGQDYLLYALKELVKNVPNISLTFMGPGDSTWLNELTEELDLTKYVQILTSRSDVSACIAASDIVVHPSLADSFSQLIIEAQAAGGLLIATDIAAAREQIIDGVTGLIIPPRDFKAIERAVLSLLKNPVLATSIRKNAPAHVQEKFTLQRMVEEEFNCLSIYAKHS
jgi:glycosyltransferase involved in cell wall biosynthesis